MSDAVVADAGCLSLCLYAFVAVACVAMIVVVLAVGPCLNRELVSLVFLTNCVTSLNLPH